MFQCKACPFSTKSPRAFTTHHKKCSTGALTCHFCDRKFPTEATWREHLEKHDRATFQCTKCHSPFVRQHGLKRHEATCKAQPTCRLCRRKFHLWPELRRHLQTHTEAGFIFGAALARHASTMSWYVADIHGELVDLARVSNLPSYFFVDKIDKF